jgi:hypothetical protein
VPEVCLINLVAQCTVMEQDFEQNFDKMGRRCGANSAKLQEGRKATTKFFLSKSHIQLKGQVFDRNQWNLWTFASLGILSLHVPCSSMALKSVALPYDSKMRYRSTGHLTTYDIFRYFYRFSDRMRPCDIGGRRMGLNLTATTDSQISSNYSLSIPEY